MSKLKFGWAEQSITPDKKVSLAGQFAERISEYVEKPICVTALAISSETDQAIFCACDLVDISWGLRDAVRAGGQLLRGTAAWAGHRLGPCRDARCLHDA